MVYKRVLIITDNWIQYSSFLDLVMRDDFYQKFHFTFRRSRSSGMKKIYELDIGKLEEIDVKNDLQYILDNFDLVISLHCKQLFPDQLVNGVKCINIHPGYNPINRGWYPQVFAINSNTDVGATIHEIDEEIDNGGIIAREKCPIYSWDTSKEVYERILILEMKLLKENFKSILLNNYSITTPEIKGKVYLKKDFRALRELHLDDVNTFENFINRLRALSHGKYKNAFFIDRNGDKIMLSITLEKSMDNNIKNK